MFFDCFEQLQANLSVRLINNFFSIASVIKWSESVCPDLNERSNSVLSSISDSLRGSRLMLKYYIDICYKTTTVFAC